MTSSIGNPQTKIEQQELIEYVSESNNYNAHGDPSALSTGCDLERH
jgi:hypothetical protein